MRNYFFLVLLLIIFNISAKLISEDNSDRNSNRNWPRYENRDHHSSLFRHGKNYLPLFRRQPKFVSQKEIFSSKQYEQYLHLILDPFTNSLNSKLFDKLIEQAVQLYNELLRFHGGCHHNNNKIQSQVREVLQAIEQIKSHKNLLSLGGTNSVSFNDKITGNNDLVVGSDITVVGNSNSVFGKNNNVVGDEDFIVALNTNTNGSENIILGGTHNTITGSNELYVGPFKVEIQQKNQQHCKMNIYDFINRR